MADGIPLEFISRQKLTDQGFAEKVEMILEEVRDGKILVLEEALSPDEKRRLMESSMEQVDEEFPGIEFSGIENGGDVYDRILNNVFSLLGKQRRKGLTIVGNSEVMEKIKESRESVSLLAKAAEEET